MLRAALVLCLGVGLVVATPAIVRSLEEIQAFRSFLENTKDNNDATFQARTQSLPQANAEELSGKYQGDIVLDDFIIESMLMDFAQGRNAYTWPNTKWPNDTVVWEFGEGEFGPLQSAAIEAGIADIEANTCVKFRYREPQDTNYVRLTGFANGCYANVGYWASRGVHTLNLARNTPGVGCFRHATIVHEWMHILGFLHMQSTYNRDEYVRIAEENLQPGSECGPGVHTLNLARNTPGVGCFRHATIVHEWMHILGFLHMQSTYNRDEYVRIAEENLQAGTEHNFDIYTSDLVDNLQIEYDYVSCLHYGPYAFSINGQRTIVALQEHEGVMGQREYITDKDWLRINRHYNCPGAWD